MLVIRATSARETAAFTVICVFWVGVVIVVMILLSSVMVRPLRVLSLRNLPCAYAQIRCPTIAH